MSFGFNSMPPMLATSMPYPGMGMDMGMGMNGYPPISQGPKLNLEGPKQDTYVPQSPLATVPQIPLQNIVANNSAASQLGSTEIALGIVEGLTAFFLLKKGGSAALKKLNGSWSKLTGKVGNVTKNAPAKLTAPATSTTKAAETTATASQKVEAEVVDDVKTTFRNVTKNGQAKTKPKTNAQAKAETPPPPKGNPTSKMTPEECQAAWKYLSSDQRKQVIGQYVKSLEKDAEALLNKSLNAEQKEKVMKEITKYINEILKNGGTIFDVPTHHKVLEVATRAVDNITAAAKATV